MDFDAVLDQVLEPAPDGEDASPIGSSSCSSAG